MLPKRFTVASLLLDSGLQSASIHDLYIEICQVEVKSNKKSSNILPGAIMISCFLVRTLIKVNSFLYILLINVIKVCLCSMLT